MTRPIYCKCQDVPVALAACITAEIEQQIRRVPEQWVWMHDRWRERRPATPQPVYVAPS